MFVFVFVLVVVFLVRSGQVMFSHDPHRFCEVSVWSGRLEGFESNTVNRTVNNQGRHRVVSFTNPLAAYQVRRGTCLVLEMLTSCPRRSVEEMYHR